MPDEKICFVIAPIGAPGTPLRKRSDQVLRHIIAPAAKDCGFKAIRADQISEAGMITRQIIDHLMADDMVVADLTGHNPNVFYELAVRHATGKSFVQIIDEADELPFDVQGLRTIKFNYQDLDSAAAAKNEIVKHMRSLMEAGTRIESPITNAIDLSALSKSGNPEERQFAQILDSLSQVTQTVAGLQRQIGVSGIGAASSRSSVSGQGTISDPVSGIAARVLFESIESVLSKDSPEARSVRELLKAKYPAFAWITDPPDNDGKSLSLPPLTEKSRPNG